MSYIIHNAVGKLSIEQSKWESFNIANVNTRKIYNKYSKVIVNLKNPYTKQIGHVDLESYHQVLLGFNGTFQEWLISLGDRALNLTYTEFKINRKGLLFREALSNGFKIVPVRSGLLPDNDFSQKAFYTDLFITKKNVDPIEMLKYTLISINGYFHLSDANSKGLWVTKGYNTLKKRRKHCIGITSFENLGELKQIPITKEMVSKLNDEVLFKDEMIIDIGENAANKTIILVLGGYLHVLDNHVFNRISDTAIRVKIKNIPLLERIHASLRDLDLEEIAIDDTFGERNINFMKLMSDEVLLKYVTLPYSFIVLLDNEEVFKEVTYPQQRTITNSFLSDVQPHLPMFTRLGKIEEYVWVRDGDKFEIMTDDCQYDNRQYIHAEPLGERSYQADGRVPNQRREKPYAYFMNLLSFLSN